jgi:thiamine-phosphate pyrophosphorylase
MNLLKDCRLYAFIDTAYLHGRSPERIARQLCEGGADLIQLRAKNTPRDILKKMAEAVLPITRAHDVGLVINDDFTLASELGAELCHLGQEDFFDAGLTHVSQLPTGEARPRVGLSTHSPVQARRALAAGPAYIAIGPVYATGTKPTAKPVTLDYVRWAAANVETPWFAIGGINMGNLKEVLAAGAKRICVVSAILSAPDIKAVCREFRKQLGD